MTDYGETSELEKLQNQLEWYLSRGWTAAAEEVRKEISEHQENLLEASVELNSRHTVVSELSDSYLIHGIALGPGDVTNGKNGRKLWPEDTLREAAKSLEGKALVRDHINSVVGNVGEVVKAKYKDGVGVLFEAELDDEELSEKIEKGRLDVSARIKHLPSDQLDKDQETDAVVVTPPAVFDNLSLVNTGASPSNEVQLGAATAMSAAELQAEFLGDDLPDDLVDRAECHWERGEVDQALECLQVKVKELERRAND